MFNPKGILISIGALLLISILYCTDRLSKISERYVNHISVYNDELGILQTTKVKGDGSKEKEIFKPLKDLCRETKWTEGLWLHCHNYCGENKTSACGGLNNARNRIQTCLRLAIDAGAGAIIPSVTWRNENNLTNTNSHTSCADRFWNMEYMQKSLARNCPQLNVRLCGDRSRIKHVIPTPERGWAQASYSKGNFRRFVETAMEIGGLNRTDISRDNSAVVSYGDTLIAWNYNISAELGNIRKALFKTIIFNRELLDLSLQVSQSPALKDGKYIGVHFRAESDWPKEFGSAADQMRFYTKELLQISEAYNLRTVYISCGDQEAINEFRQRLIPLGFNVVDKSSLLQDRAHASASLLAAVEKLDFDQKAIVEYETLIRSTFFIGLVTSTMSSLIAYARTVDDGKSQEDFFEKYIFPGSWNRGIYREYPGLSMMGNRGTRLIVVSGVDVMSSFP